MTPAAPAHDASMDVTAVIVAMMDKEQPYAGEAIASVLRQTHPAVAVRVYVQHANAWIDAIARQWPGVEVRRIDLMTPSGVRNRGTQDASTPWVAFLDADDRWHPTKLERQLQAARPGVLMITCDHFLVDAQGRFPTATPCRKLPVTAGWLVRRQAMLERPFKPEWATNEDGFWWLLYRGWEFTTRLPEILCDYRILPVSLSSGTASKRRKLAVLRWAGVPLLGPLLRRLARVVHWCWRSRRYPAL